MLDPQNKKLLRLLFILMLLLTLLIWLRLQFFDYDFRVKYETDFSKTGSFYSYVADTSLYHFTPYEGKMLTKTDLFSPDFLTYFPRKVGPWEGKEIEHPYADISKFYLFHHPKTDDDVWFIAVHGAHESQFHAAEVCYLVDGWDVAVRDIKKIEMNEVSLPLRYAIAEKEGSLHLVAYWYVWKTPQRRISDGVWMFRISVEVKDDELRAQKALLSFIENFVNLSTQTATKGDLAKESLPVSILKAPPVTVQKSEFLEAKQKALGWLLQQQVPNEVVPYPLMSRRHLLLSFELNTKNPQTQNDRSYPFIFSRSSIYDDALGVIAFTMAEHYEAAEKVMDAVERIIEKEGRLWFSYNTHNEWPSAGETEGAIVRTGASAWMAYAILFYVRKRVRLNPSFVQSRSYERYLAFAKQITDALLPSQILNVKDPRYGFFTGGMGSHELTWNEKTQKVVEVYHAAPIEWASLEHNIDLYFVLRDLILWVPEKKYEMALAILKQALLTRGWNATVGQLNRGARREGMDEVLALDCASWGAMLFQSMKESLYAEKSLKAMERYAVKEPTLSMEGYRPYTQNLVYDEEKLNKLFYPHRPQKSWSDIAMVWSEGSLGAAMAYLKLAHPDKTKVILKEIMKLQKERGGLLYATQEIPFQFSPTPSVAGTAWFIMVIEALEDPRDFELFWN